VWTISGARIATGARSTAGTFEELMRRKTPEDAMADLTHAAEEMERLKAGLDRLIHSERPRYRRLWAYFKNPMRICSVVDTTAGNCAQRPYRQAQEWGLPARITGFCSGGEPFVSTEAGGIARKEVVIENDIGWRVETLVDYLFGKPLVISSAAPDAKRREVIARLLAMILEANGGIQFLQQLALIGSVYGFVDVLVKVESKSSPGGYRTPGTQVEAGPAPTGGPSSRGEGERAAAIVDEGSNPDANNGEDALLRRVARMIRLEIVEPARALPLLSVEDYRVVEGYGQVWEREGQGLGVRVQGLGKSGWWDRFRGIWPGQGRDARRSEVQVVELITSDRWMRIEQGKIVAEGGNSLGEVPLVHIQNSAEAFT
jgi:hypothetical protein